MFNAPHLLPSPPHLLSTLSHLLSSPSHLLPSPPNSHLLHTSSHLFLLFLAYPTIFNITQTPDAPPNAGTPLTLWCTIQPYPQLTSPTYSMAWYKDGATFYQASGLVASCTFGALSTSNNGYYECYATILDISGLSLTTRLGSVTLTVGGKKHLGSIITTEHTVHPLMGAMISCIVLFAHTC